MAYVPLTIEERYKALMNPTVKTTTTTPNAAYQYSMGQAARTPAVTAEDAIYGAAAKASLPASSKASSSSSSSKSSSTKAAVATEPVVNPLTSILYGATMPAQRAQLKGIEELAALYGNITYDQSAIEAIFNAATDKQYEASRKAYERSAQDYYKNIAVAQNTSLEALRKSQAIQSGANAGMQNANALSAILGISQTAAPDALTLAQEYRALEDEYAAALAANTKESLEYANTVKQALATLGATIYGVDAQQYASELGYNAQVTAANTAASAQGYTADQQLAGVKYNADSNLAAAKASAAASRYAANSSANIALQQMATNLKLGNISAVTDIGLGALAKTTDAAAIKDIINTISSAYN